MFKATRAPLALMPAHTKPKTGAGVSLALLLTSPKTASVAPAVRGAAAGAVGEDAHAA